MTNGGDLYERVCACLRTAAPGDAVPADVAGCARVHSVHLLLADRWQRSALADELRHAAIIEALRAEELRAVLAKIADAGVRPILLKGAAIAYTHYPRPELRPRADTDMLIPAAARDAVARSLAALGYRRPPEIDGDIAIGQFHFLRHDRHGFEHAMDVHWRVSNVRAFADAVSYEELARAAVAVPALGSHAWSPSPVHALLVACVHRVAHHDDTNNLLWLYDVHLLARRFTRAEWEAFAGLARERGMRAVCARTLALAQEAFGGFDSARIASVTPPDDAIEPAAAFLGGGLRQFDILGADLAATRGWLPRVQLLREHLFPSVSYMRHRYARWPGALLPFAYVDRMVRGARRWLRR
jgi:hypothetical protein